MVKNMNNIKRIGKYIVIKQKVSIQSFGNIVKCECGNDKWDIIREYSGLKLIIAIALCCTIILLPIGIPLYLSNKNIRACSECEKIYMSGN